MVGKQKHWCERESVSRVMKSVEELLPLDF